MLTKDQMLSDLKMLSSEEEYEYFETLQYEDVKRYHENLFGEFEYFEGNDKNPTAKELEVLRKRSLPHGQENCEYCPPYKGDNASLAGRVPKHGSKKPKYKNKRV